MERKPEIEKLTDILVEQAEFLAKWNELHRENSKDIINIRSNTNTIRDILETINHLYW